MHRIDSSGNVDNQFHPGNPATGQQATQIDAPWLNAVQEEIAGVIEGANISLAKGTNNQLAAAITALIAGVVGDGSGAVPTTRQLLTSGLATGGGTLAADRTVDVPKASASEVAALTEDAKAVTPLALAGLVGWSTVGSALVGTLGNGIIQCFTATAGANGTTVITLPQAFGLPCRAVCSGGLNDTGAQDNSPHISGTGTSTVSVFSALGSSVTINIIAIGVS